MDFISDDERRLIRLAKLAVARARYASLQRDINKLQRDTRRVQVTPAVLADRLFSILGQYRLEEMEDQGHGVADAPRKADTEPEIIVSESFDFPA
jgi:hypothetical protein